MDVIPVSHIVIYVCLIAMNPAVALMPPAWQSDWLLMVSQSNYEDNYYKEISHPLGTVPMKVKVLVRPVRGANTDLLYEASTSIQWDDDYDVMYCGLQYVYDDKVIKLYAPKEKMRTIYPEYAHFSSTSKGRIFCTGKGAWSDGTGHHQDDNEAYVKIQVWDAASFVPPPSFESSWIDIQSSENSRSESFVEVPHNMGLVPDMVLLQLYVTKAGVSTYGEGYGSTYSGAEGTVTGGVVYGFNDKNIRVWAPSPGSVMAIKDGWGATIGRINSSSAKFIIRAWLSFGKILQSQSFALSQTSIPNLSSLPIISRGWNLETGYLAIQVKALDGANGGYTFSGIGQVQRTAFPNTTFGGLAFGYRPGQLRLFLPTADGSSIIHILKSWGDGNYTQHSNNVQVAVKIWIPYTSTYLKPVCTQETGRFITPAGYKYNAGCSRHAVESCLLTCLKKESCRSARPCDQGVCSHITLEDTFNAMTLGLFDFSTDLLLDDTQCLAYK